MRIVFILVLLALFGCSESNNYDECILKHMEGVKSDHGAKLIRKSCYDKHNKKAQPTGVRKLELKEQSKITGRAGVGYTSNYYTGNIYNGNELLTITEVKIKITTKSGKSESYKEYIDTVNISPLSTGEFAFTFMPGDKGSDYSWNIVSAKGYKSQ
tara:strand:- start:1103 stop:1570 length:468 start_codon:yes stop_codon:yes gene_type:complete